MYTINQLKADHKTLAAAKAYFGLKARSWEALADKLGQSQEPSDQGLIAELRATIARLEGEIQSLQQPDLIGFWLMDGNFERSRFSDFDLPAMALQSVSAAKAWHKKLARRYHPDKGGTPEQMANLNRMLDQMLALAELSEGMAA